MNANDSSPETSPFLSGTLDVAQDNKHAPASPGDEEQVYLESLYNSMLKQQEWLSLEIKKIQKVRSLLYQYMSPCCVDNHIHLETVESV